jgi:hypothetical protein
MEEPREALLTTGMEARQGDDVVREAQPEPNHHTYVA